MFSADTNRFLTDLAANNSRDWFDAHRARYEAHVKSPADPFAQDVGAQLSRAQGVAVTHKVFRLFRDVRFSKDKTPYNTHIRILWSVPDSALGWMLSLEPQVLILGFGCFGFQGETLDRWRAAVAGDAGTALAEAVAPFDLDPPELKRVPAPYPADHPRADLLRRKGLAVWQRQHPVTLAHGEGATAAVFAAMAPFDPVRRWVLAQGL